MLVLSFDTIFSSEELESGLEEFKLISYKYEVPSYFCLRRLCIILGLECVGTCSLELVHVEDAIAGGHRGTIYGLIFPIGMVTRGSVSCASDRHQHK